MLRRENILITENYMSKTTSATHFTAPGEIECFDSSIHFGKESDRVEIQNCNIKSNVLVHCSKDDTYDFEVGALIALMKMCGVEKVVRACNEAFSEDTFKTYATMYERELNSLKKENNYLKYIKSCRESAINSLENTRDLLINKNNELIEENEKLKLDCEKLQHGYIDTDMIFCGGRQNGKQYTALVDLFKKLDQKKVDAVYKEAYNTTLPLWQKEVLNQMYGVYKESKGETELPRTLDINGVKYRKMLQIKDFGKEIKIKPPTKREKMWDDILACGDCEHSKYVKVKKEDLEMFAKECNEKKIFSIIGYEFHPQEFWFYDDSCIFQIFRKPAGFICAKGVSYVLKDTIIDYLPPMRWDLFKKGRIAVGVRKEHYDEFKKEITRQFGLTNQHKPYEDFNYSFYMHYKNVNFIEAVGRSQFRQLTMINNHKVVYWEDVR